MKLRDLIAQLNREPDRNRILRYGFRNPHSYRGYYCDLAFSPASGVSIQSMLDAAKRSVGEEFTGWKGGHYEMGLDTTVWIAIEGCSSEDDVPLSAGNVADMLATAGAAPGPTTDDMFNPEDDLIGRVCDQIDRANPDLPIEACQTIAQDIIRLVREYT